MTDEHRLNLAQRINAVRKDVTYVQRTQGDRGNVVMQADVVKKIRPALVEHGVLFVPVDCEVLHRDFFKVPKSGGGERAVFYSQIIYTFRLINVDDPDDVIDVPVMAEALDDQDKGPGKAFTYASKYALLHALNIERGDDPDMDPVSFDLSTDPERASRIERVKVLAAAIEPADPDSVINAMLEAITKKFSRPIRSVVAVPLNVLDDYIVKMEERAGVEHEPRKNGTDEPRVEVLRYESLVRNTAESGVISEDDASVVVQAIMSKKGFTVESFKHDEEFEDISRRLNQMTPEAIKALAPAPVEPLELQS